MGDISVVEFLAFVGGLLNLRLVNYLKKKFIDNLKTR